MPSPAPPLRAFLIASITLCLLCVCAYVVAVYTLPNIVQRKTETLITRLNPNAPPLPKPEKRINAIRYSNVALDNEDFNSISNITIEYKIPSFIISGIIDKITIDGLHISANMDMNNALSINGFNALTDNQPPILNVNNISITNATLSILNAHLGGLRMDGNAQITRNDALYTLTGTLEGQQKNFAIDAKLNATLGSAMNWSAITTIESMRLNTSSIKLTRAHGKLDLRGNNLNINTIAANIQSGGLSLDNTPWQSANLTLNGEYAIPDIFIEAKSLPPYALELSIESSVQDQPRSWDGRIFANNGADIHGYIRAHKNLELQTPPPNAPLQLLFKHNKNLSAYQLQTLNGSRLETGNF